jgi:hypothetical protein
MRSALLALLLLAGCASTSHRAPTAGIDPIRMSNMVRTLASGEAKTIAYISEQFRLAGLEPAGENGGWTQKVPLVRTQLAKDGSVSLAAKGGRVALRVPDDVYLSTVRETSGRGSTARRWSSSATESPRPSGNGTISRAST